MDNFGVDETLITSETISSTISNEMKSDTILAVAVAIICMLIYEKDILKLVNTIIVNTKGEGQQSGEDFWVKAEKLYYTALIAYIW